MRNSHLFFLNVTTISMCTIAGVKKYNIIIYLLIVIFMKKTLIVLQINLIDIKWIRPFKFVRLPTKFLSMYTFAKRGPGNKENLQETGQFFPDTSENMPRNYLRFNFTAEMLPAYIVAMATLCRVGFLIPDF